MDSQGGGYVCFCPVYVSDSFLEVTKEEHFIRLSLDELKTYLQALNDIVSPDKLLMSVLSWIEYDKESRKKALDYTQRYLKLKECGKHFLSESSKEHIEIFRSNPEFNRRVTGMLQPRKLSPVVIGGNIYVLDDTYFFNTTVWQLKSETKFADITNIPAHMLNACPIICLYDSNHLILTGGYLTDVCAMFDISSKKWRKLKSLKSQRARHASVCVMQQLFVLGGITELSPSVQWIQNMEVLNLV